MRCTLIPARELDTSLIERWSAIQEADFELASPYFRPEFTEAVAAVRNDVWIGLLEEGGRVAGFFPFHRQLGGIARPLGLGLSDHHGVIVDRNVGWSARALMEGCGIVRFPFDHLLASQQQWQSFHSRLARSPIIDTSQGYAHYEAVRNKMNGRQLKDAFRCIRKLEREYQAHRFTASTQDPRAFEAAIKWKRAQCRQTGAFDYFSRSWTVELLQRLLAAQSPKFAGVLSSVYVDDTLIAVHFGMRSEKAMHFWFPSYNGQYAKYSPGSILLVELIDHACSNGIEYIDLGKGMAQYKERFMTGWRVVAEGTATRQSVVNLLVAAREKSEQWSRTSALRPLLRWPGRLMRRLERGLRHG